MDDICLQDVSVFIDATAAAAAVIEVVLFDRDGRTSQSSVTRSF